MFKYALLIISSLLFLTACGQVGPLYLPGPPPTKQATAVKKVAIPEPADEVCSAPAKQAAKQPAKSPAQCSSKN